MDVIPVLDLLNGVVVRGVAGHRERYRPVNSVLTPSRDPSVVLKVIRDQFSLTSFYVADLDALQFRQLNRCTIAEMTRSDVSLMVDAGIRCEHDVQELLDLGVDQVVVALETLPDIATAEKLTSAFDAASLILSVDLKNGRPLTKSQQWQDTPPTDLAKRFLAMGFENMIVLDLAAVGMEEGMLTLQLCSELRSLVPDGKLITGGGVSSVEHLQQAQQVGVDGVLIASALHNGQLQPADLNSFLTGSAE